MKYTKILTVVALAGCSSMDPGTDTCFTHLAIEDREPGRVTYAVPVVDFDTQLTAPIPVPGLVMQVCTNATCLPEYPLCAGDVGNCYREFPGPSPAVKVLDFPFGLANVTLRFSAPGYISTDYPLGGPLIGSPSGELTVRGVGIVLVKEETYTQLHAQAGAVPSPQQGTLAIRVLDCAGQRAADQTIEPWNADLQGTTRFSLSSNNLATSARITTDQRGVAGFLNLPPQTLDVWIPAWNQNPVTFNVRPGVLTLGELRWGLDDYAQ